jgi:exopolyphosphatase/guanosine-5'-triphosphate,3'-diphosphate pyrophosphatase
MDQLLAAVDLGSNSFRLSIGRVVQHDGGAQIYAIDRLKESVRLAAGLGPDKMLSEEAMDRAISVLKRFGERIAGFHPNRVRAVATNTFRVARNAVQLLPRAEAALGFPIEVISGQEEARLIFSGVANELPPSPNKRLVIDIGGGSTEVIIGRGYEPLRMASLYMGCVSYGQAFFPDGRITAARMEQAQLAARREFETISWPYRKTGWQEAYGSSGTAKGLYAVLTEGSMSSKGITQQGLEKLRAKLIRDGRVIIDELPGLKPDRAPVLAPGLAIMLAAFDELHIKLMRPGDGALRVGVLYDLLGRDSDHDKREQTVHQFIKRYHIDMLQADRVRKLALHFFEQLDLPEEERPDLARALNWAADLHETGLSIAHADYHKHSAYILGHADMPGFSNDGQALLAWLALGHQGKLNKLRAHESTHAQWLTLLCLRLAVLLSRRREDLEKPPLAIAADARTIRIRVNGSWLAEHPLSAYTLRGEVAQWNKAGFEMELQES